MHKENLKDDLKIVAILVGIFLAVVLPITAAVLFVNIQLPTTGVTASADLLVYELDGVTLKTDLSWGNALVDGVYTQGGIIENVGTVSLTLSMIDDASLPWLVQTWDQEGTLLASGSQVITTWTLTLTAPPEGNSFSYDTTIIGTET